MGWGQDSAERQEKMVNRDTSPFDGKGYPLPLLDEPESIAVGKIKLQSPR